MNGTLFRGLVYINSIIGISIIIFLTYNFNMAGGNISFDLNIVL